MYCLWSLQWQTKVLTSQCPSMWVSVLYDNINTPRGPWSRTFSEALSSHEGNPFLSLTHVFLHFTFTVKLLPIRGTNFPILSWAVEVTTTNTRSALSMVSAVIVRATTCCKKKKKLKLYTKRIGEKTNTCSFTSSLISIGPSWMKDMMMKSIREDNVLILTYYLEI